MNNKMNSQWIPCSERMPNDSRLVYVTDCNGMVRIRRFYGNCWWDDFREYDYNKEFIIAWMPIKWPEPYEGEL